MKNLTENQKKLKTLGYKMALCLVMIIASVVGIVWFFFLPETWEQWWKYAVLIGSAVVFLCFVIWSAVLYHRSNKLKRLEQAEITPQEDVIDVTVENGENGQPITTVTYPTQPNTYKFVNMGQRQSVEDKFEQIAKMDKTQFVIYCARLFGLNGYSVKLTPVLNNKSVDLVIEKSGETIAVGCINGSRLLSVADVKPVLAGSAFYHTNKCMIITNMYFDKEATYFAQSHNVALVDRTTIIKDYMM